MKPLLDTVNPSRESFLKPRKLLKNPKWNPENRRDSSNQAVPYPNNQRNEQGNQNDNNGNFQSQNNHATPKRLLKPQQEKILTQEEAKKYLKLAKDDKPLARRLAKADGWTIPD
jgi:hypothetical protein